MGTVAVTSVYHANHKLHILDVRGSESKTVGNNALQWSGSGLIRCLLEFAVKFR